LSFRLINDDIYISYAYKRYIDQDRIAENTDVYIMGRSETRLIHFGAASVFMLSRGMGQS
ncbi:hypothetical protein, partial [Yersinia pestis]|uniref:hypothetical protein n=1 Tax=Yersinia pestis TaxID=632 RepID=UPI000577A7A4